MDSAVVSYGLLVFLEPGLFPWRELVGWKVYQKQPIFLEFSLEETCTLAFDHQWRVLFFSIGLIDRKRFTDSLETTDPIYGFLHRVTPTAA